MALKPPRDIFSRRTYRKEKMILMKLVVIAIALATRCTSTLGNVDHVETNKKMDMILLKLSDMGENFNRLQSEVKEVKEKVDRLPVARIDDRLADLMVEHTEIKKKLKKMDEQIERVDAHVISTVLDKRVETVDTEMIAQMLTRGYVCLFLNA